MDTDPKWIFQWRPISGTRVTEFAARAQAELVGRLRGLGASALSLHLTEELPPRLTLVPYRRDPMALIGVRAGLPALLKAREVLKMLPGSVFAWKVTESIPVERARTWPTGERAPGACLLTLFRAHPRLSRQAFLHEWYERHTPLSLRIHPLAGYVRNAVEESLLAGSPVWDGIVTESFRDRADLLSHLRLFGGPLRCLPNMVRVGLHVSKFLDFPSIENYLVAEVALPC